VFYLAAGARVRLFYARIFESKPITPLPLTPKSVVGSQRQRLFQRAARARANQAAGLGIGEQRILAIGIGAHGKRAASLRRLIAGLARFGEGAIGSEDVRFLPRQRRARPDSSRPGGGRFNQLPRLGISADGGLGRVFFLASGQGE
jgi:hypothetical protein